jgi:hypothetical protein
MQGLRKTFLQDYFDPSRGLPTFFLSEERLKLWPNFVSKITVASSVSKKPLSNNSV